MFEFRDWSRFPGQPVKVMSEGRVVGTVKVKQDIVYYNEKRIGKVYPVLSNGQEGYSFVGAGLEDKWFASPCIAGLRCARRYFGRKGWT